MAIIQAGECLGVLYRNKPGGQVIVHDGVLVSPKKIDTKDRPFPKQITIIHININRNTGDLFRQGNLKINNILDIEKTPFNKEDQKKRCTQNVAKPEIKAGACVAIKFKINSPKFPGKREVKNGRLLCPITDGNNPPNEVFIYHWLIENKNGAKPKLILDLKRYSKVTFVEEVKLKGK